MPSPSILLAFCLSAAIAVNARVINTSPLNSRSFVTQALRKRSFVQGGSCTTDQWERFENESNQLISIVDKVDSIIAVDSEYYTDFLDPTGEDTDFLATYKSTYLQSYQGLINDPNFPCTIECGNAAQALCDQGTGDPGHSVPYAVTVAEDQTIYFCDPFFALDETSDGQQDSYCNVMDRTLGEFETGAFTLLHEYGHLDCTIHPKLEDVRYCDTGSACQDLAEEDVDEARMNADSWMFTAMGIYYKDRCERSIPLE